MPDPGFDPGAATSLLTVEQMYEADRRTMTAGTPGVELMEQAGRAVADAIRSHFAICRVLVLCGPGNNGGDGFVVARLLADAGWPVLLALMGRRDALKGDAAVMAGRWQGEVLGPETGLVADAELVVDALFGAGLARPLDGAAAGLVEAVKARGAPVVAVDMPSGVDGDTGEIRGTAAPAALTVTFCRAKPGHLLLPGRALAGETVVADIGIPDSVVREVGPAQWRNGPGLWGGIFPWPTIAGHKYSRGHTVVGGADLAQTGASRMAARAALRVGSGLVTVAAPPGALQTYAAHLTAVMLRRVNDTRAFAEMLADKRLNTVLLGPGQGVGDRTRDAVIAALDARKSCVLDADALTSFADDPAALFARLHGGCVLTPHDGEFARLFVTDGDKLTRTRRAARDSGAVVLLKGADTVIAAPDGAAVINDNAPPELATAGAGDVLAGFVAGLLAQGVAALPAAAMAAWLHGAAGEAAGPGLIAEDLPEMLPRVLRRMKETDG